MVGAVLGAREPGDFDKDAGAFGTLLRFAIICIFLRSAERRERMLWTTTMKCQQRT